MMRTCNVSFLLKIRVLICRHNDYLTTKNKSWVVSPKDPMITAILAFKNGQLGNTMMGVFGPPSSGKTSTLKTLARLMDLDIGIINCLGIQEDSHLGARRESGFHEWLATDNGKKKLVIADEFEKSNRNAIMRTFQVYLSIFSLSK